MLKAVIFDFDNTLMDFMKMKRAAVESAVDGMIDAGLLIKKEEMVEKIYKVYTAEGIEDQQIFDKVLIKELGKVDYKILAAGIIGYRRAKEGTLALYPHVHLTLTGLARMGLKMAVVSDAPRLPVWLRITGLGLQHYFDTVVTSDDAGFKKPHAKPFLMALEKLNVAPAEAMMIGDWIERDMVGAKTVGLQTVFARYGNIASTVKESGADFEIDDVSELLAIVAKRAFLMAASPSKELVFFPAWTAGREGYAARIREVFQKHLSEQGLRLTTQREAIIDLLLKAEQHVSQQDVYKALKGQGLGKVTVFRTLKMLEECGLVERVTSPHGSAKFEIKYERPHHDHLVCVECGVIREVQWPDVERIQDKTCRTLHFTPLWHRHEIFGRCETCQSKRV